MIRFREVSFSYGEKKVLQGLCQTLPLRGIVAVMGPSGCGKTTLLHLLAGLLRPTGGAIEGLRDLRVSMVFQEDRLLPWRTAAGNVTLAAPNADAAALLARLGLAGQEGKMPGELSGGMNRRVALARALACDGDLYLLDEPFKGLDPAAKTLAMEPVRELGRRALVVMVTHDESEARSLTPDCWKLDCL